MIRDIIVELLYAELRDHFDKDAVSRMIEIPPAPDTGDFALPCFPLAKIYRKNPAMIADWLADKFKDDKCFSEVKSVSGYLNFYVDRNLLTEEVLSNASLPAYGRKKESKRMVIEFPSPNTNKPLHLGHLRNMAIGESVSRILEFTGNDAIRVCLYNDRGVHICKSMLAYRELGNGETPESANRKPDHLIGDYYVRFSEQAEKDPSWNEKAQEMLRQWEAGDEDIRKLWSLMNSWAYRGYEQTYELCGIRFDKEYYESDIYKKGKEIVQDGLKRGIFLKKDDGAVMIDLEAEKLGEKILLRSDGTSVYIVQDLYLAILKDEEYKYDQSLYVVGNEQDYHFLVLKTIFEKLGYDIAGKIHHLSYGMVELPEGKMKSREGTVVDADDLILETKNLAAQEVRSRYDISEAETEDRSLKIALAAIKYQLLRVDIAKNMLFDPKTAIRFDGDTGPYLLYSYARSSSIIRKAGGDIPEGIVFNDKMNDSEHALLRKLDFFPECIVIAREKLSPAIIAGYAFELSRIFNEFYHNSPVLNSDKKDFRLRLVSAFRSVLKDCLRLLGIDEIEEM